MSIAPDLFTMPPTPAKAPPGRLVGQGIPLRWCQREDVDALMHAIETGHNRPCCVAATGYGKGALTAELAGRLKAATGKVVCLVDREHLVEQNADEWERHLGVEVGRVAGGECDKIHLPYVVATVQAMYTPDRTGKPLYAYPQFEGTRSVLVDEGHKFFAPCFRSVADHFAENNGAVIVGFTATPVAANGDEWRDFFNWTPAVEGPCMRTVQWCVANGLLVPLQQAWVHIDLRLQDLYQRVQDTLGGDEGEDDDAEDVGAVLLDLLKDKGEQAAARFAAGVADVIGAHRALIFSPARVKAAQTIASWLGSVGRLSCDAVWGARVDKAQALERFKRGRPQAMANVNLLCEGFNDPNISAVFICRLLKQWRLVQQMVGRALRPHPSIVAKLNELDGPDFANERRAVITGSQKPFALIADLVGLEEKALRASAVDVMFPDASEAVRTEAAEVLRSRSTGPRPPRVEVDEAVMEAARAQLLTRQNEALQEMARRRGMAGDLPADVTVTYGSPIHGAELPNLPAPKLPATPDQVKRLVAYGFTPESAARRTRNEARGIIGRKIREGAKPDWSRVRRLIDSPAEQAASRAAATAGCDLSKFPPSPWQMNRLHALGYSGSHPPSHASARRLISELEAQRRVGAA